MTALDRAKQIVADMEEISIPHSVREECSEFCSSRDLI